MSVNNPFSYYLYMQLTLKSVPQFTCKKIFLLMLEKVGSQICIAMLLIYLYARIKLKQLEANN